MTEEIATLRKRVILSPLTPMTDERFIANIDDINELINLCDDEGLDRTQLRRQLGEFYPELIRRINAQPSVQPDLREAGLVSKNALVQILGNGSLSRAIEVEANAFSKKAEEAITAAGGTVTKK